MEYFDAMCDPDRVVEADFARKLERERDAAIAERDAAIADLNILCDKVLELNTLLQKHENQND